VILAVRLAVSVAIRSRGRTSVLLGLWHVAGDGCDALQRHLRIECAVCGQPEGLLEEGTRGPRCTEANSLTRGLPLEWGSIQGILRRRTK
jgi:hypothetical protein